MGWRKLAILWSMCRALVIQDGTMRLVEAEDVLQQGTVLAGQLGSRQQMPGAACLFLHPHSCSSCGRYCLLACFKPKDTATTRCVQRAVAPQRCVLWSQRL